MLKPDECPIKSKTLMKIVKILPNVQLGEKITIEGKIENIRILSKEKLYFLSHVFNIPSVNCQNYQEFIFKYLSKAIKNSLNQSDKEFSINVNNCAINFCNLREFIIINENMKIKNICDINDLNNISIFSSDNDLINDLNHDLTNDSIKTVANNQSSIDCKEFITLELEEYIYV